VVLGWRLDLVVLEVFSNLSDSMILLYQESVVNLFWRQVLTDL